MSHVTSLWRRCSVLSSQQPTQPWECRPKEATKKQGPDPCCLRGWPHPRSPMGSRCRTRRSQGCWHTRPDVHKWIPQCTIRIQSFSLRMQRYQQLFIYSVILTCSNSPGSQLLCTSYENNYTLDWWSWHPSYRVICESHCDKLQLEDLLDGLAVGSRVGHNQQPGLQVLLPKPRFKHTALVLNCTGQGTKGHHWIQFCYNWTSGTRWMKDSNQTPCRLNRPETTKNQREFPFSPEPWSDPSVKRVIVGTSRFQPCNVLNFGKSSGTGFKESRLTLKASKVATYTLTP